MIREIEAKVMLSHVKQPDSWFGLTYNMNLYRGCQHQCIYCDSRSECYRIQNFNDVLVKVNAPGLLRKELRSKRTKGTIGTGSMNDPYMPLERKYNLTGQALELIALYRFPVHIITKSDLVLRDLETLVKINEVYAAVSFTITTADDRLARKLEPGAPPPSQRFEAMAVLAEHGILTGVTMMPVLPFIEDNQENIDRILERAKAHGASYVLPTFGMTLRDRQRAYYYKKLDKLFPAITDRYRRRFGNDYFCPVENAAALEKHFNTVSCQLGIANRIPPYEPLRAAQLSLF